MPKPGALVLCLKRALLILIFASLIFSVSTSSPPKVTAAEPAPKPCFNPEPTDNLTDNYITDHEGDPPGPEGANNIEALKFTYVVQEPIGTIPDLRKTIQFKADFSKLQAIFASQNSNYLENATQSQNRAKANLSTMPGSKLMDYQGPLQKTTPKVITDALRQKYVEKVYEKPEIQGSDLKFSDFTGKVETEKNIHELVETPGFGIPDPPKNGESRQSWIDTWGKYWEKIPTTYNEFYIGKLEFRPVHGTTAIAALKRGDPGSCFPNTALRSVEFPVPNFFRTSAISGQLNQVLVPKAAQSPGNILINVKDNILGVKTSVQNFVENCFKFASDNPVTRTIKKGLEISLEKIDLTKNVNAASCSISNASVVAGGTKVVTHNGFAAGEDIRLFGILDQRSLRTTNDSTGGSTTRTVTIPSDVPAGDYNIVIVTRFPITSTTCSGGPFAVTAPAPTPTPTPIPATCSYTGANPATAGSSTISVTHRGFAAGETIRIADKAFGTTRDLGTTVDSIASSKTQGPFTIPAGISGDWSVVVTTRFPAVNFNCGDITINAPAASPSPSPGVASCTFSGPNPATAGISTISVTHNGFASGETIRLADKAFGTVQNLSTTTDSRTSSQTQGPFTIPAGISGDWSVVVTTRFPAVNFNCGDITINAPAAPTCSYVSSATPPVPGTQLNITHQGFAAGETIRIADRLFGIVVQNLGTTIDSTGGQQTQTVTIPILTSPISYTVMITTRFPAINFSCGDIDIANPPPGWTLSVEDPTTRAGDALNFTISPAVTSADSLILLVYRWDPVSNTQIDCTPLTASFDPCYDSGFLQPGPTVTWTPLVNGTFRAILLNQWLGEASNQVIFDVGFILEQPQVNGRTVTFNWNPQSDGNIALIVRKRSDRSVTVFDSGSLYGGNPIPLGTKTLTWYQAPPGEYEVALLNLFLAPITPWIPFDVSFAYTWTVFDLKEDSCIKVHETTGKAGNAPYCALYPTKFEFPGQQNVKPGECGIEKTDSFKLNPEQNVVCTFSFEWHSTDYNGTDKELKIPDTGNGNWDTCDPAQGNVRTCYLTVGVWPDFKIPFLGQVWNNALYADKKEALPRLQDTGRPGVYSFFRPQATDYDPFAAAVEACNVDVDPSSQACNYIVNKLTSGDYPKQYPGIEDCVTQNLLGGMGLGNPGQSPNYNLVKCVHGIAKLITKKLPGEVNTNVLGTNTGQVLAGNDGPQKERFIGSVDCEKHFVRDIALKPKALQEHLGIKTECDLTASPVPGGTPLPSPTPGYEPTPSPDTRIGSGCDGGSAFAALLPNPIPQSVGATSPSLLNRIGSNLLDAARYGSSKSGVACELLIGLHYVEAGWDASGSFISGRTIGTAEPDVPTAAACTAYNGTWTGGGCVFSTLPDTAYYAGDHIKDKMSALGRGWTPPANFNDMIGAMSYYNGGGNANCGEGVPYNSPCPPPIGIDDPYSVSHFDAAHAQMYLIYCADLIKCDPPRAFPRDGAATAAKEFYLR